MFVLFEIIDLGSIELLFAGVPESVGLLLFGVTLVVMAMLIRRFMARGERDEKSESLES